MKRREHPQNLHGPLVECQTCQVYQSIALALLTECYVSLWQWDFVHCMSGCPSVRKTGFLRTCQVD